VDGRAVEPQCLFDGGGPDRESSFDGRFTEVQGSHRRAVDDAVIEVEVADCRADEPRPFGGHQWPLVDPFDVLFQ